MNNIKLKWKFKKGKPGCKTGTGKAGTVSLFPGSGSAGEESKLSPVFQKKEGICAWCERWWSTRSGGLNKNDLCPECARNMHSPLPDSKAVSHA